MKKFRWNDPAPGYLQSSKVLLKQLASMDKNVTTGTMADILLEIVEILEENHSSSNPPSLSSD